MRFQLNTFIEIINISRYCVPFVIPTVVTQVTRLYKLKLIARKVAQTIKQPYNSFLYMEVKDSYVVESNFSNFPTNLNTIRENCVDIICLNLYSNKLCRRNYWKLCGLTWSLQQCKKVSWINQWFTWSKKSQKYTRTPHKAFKFDAIKTCRAQNNKANKTY